MTGIGDAARFLEADLPAPGWPSYSHSVIRRDVVGLGAMGERRAYQLASAGKRVLGIDRYQPPHTPGIA
jgi:hypothetical protein